MGGEFLPVEPPQTDFGDPILHMLGILFNIIQHRVWTSVALLLYLPQGNGLSSRIDLSVHTPIVFWALILLQDARCPALGLGPGPQPSVNPDAAEHGSQHLLTNSSTMLQTL